MMNNKPNANGWRRAASLAFVVCHAFLVSRRFVGASGGLNISLCFLVEPHYEPPSSEEEGEFLDCFEQAYNAALEPKGYHVNSTWLISNTDFEKYATCRCPRNSNQIWHTCMGCTHYFACSRSGDTLGNLIECPDGTLFDETAQICQWGDASICQSDPENAPDTSKPDGRSCPLGHTGIMPFDECRSYYHCINGAVVGNAFTCPKNTLFDKLRQHCNWKSHVKCTVGKKLEGVPTSNGELCPSGFTGWKAHKDCMEFFYCLDGKKEGEFKKCSRGTLFDEARGDCNWARNVVCHSGSGDRRQLGKKKKKKTAVGGNGKCNKCYDEGGPPADVYQNRNLRALLSGRDSGDEGDSRQLTSESGSGRETSYNLIHASIAQNFMSCLEDKHQTHGLFSGYEGLLSGYATMEACYGNDFDW